MLGITLSACTAGKQQVSSPTPLAIQTPLPPSASPSPSPMATPVVSATPSKKPTPSPLAKLVIKQLPSEFKSDSSRDVQTIDTIVIHSHYNPTAKDPFSIESSKAVFDAEQVSAHYVIDRTGTVWQLVPENYMAWHAGVSQMPAPDNRTAVNYFSIGIELAATKTSGYTASQYQSLVRLCTDIIGRLPIKYVVGHSTISPGRKTDPWLFDWKQFASELTHAITKPIAIITPSP